MDFSSEARADFKLYGSSQFNHIATTLFTVIHAFSVNKVLNDL